MPEEEVHFIQTCCYILKVSDDERVKFITIKAVNKGNEDPSLTIVAIGKMLEALGNKAEAFRRASPTPSRTTCNADIMVPPARILEHLGESANSLKDALHQGFMMGI